jgi:hypothetical protein
MFMFLDTVWNAVWSLDYVSGINAWSSNLNPVDSILKDTVLLHLEECGVLDVVLIEFSLDQSHGEHSLDGGILHIMLSIIKLLPLRVSSMRSNLCLDYVKVLFSFGANSLGLLDALGNVTHVHLRFKSLLDALR